MSTKHGDSGRTGRTAEYTAWANMVARCSNHNHPRWKWYGARGIKVCKRWVGKHGFKNFLTDVGRRPRGRLSLDRFPDNDGDYKPGNVRWATAKQQAQNRRPRVG